jgi:hypothetical protein
MVDPSENGFFWNLDSLRAPLTENGLAVLESNFWKASWVKSIMEFPAPTGVQPQVIITYRLFAPCSLAEYNTLPEDQRLMLEGSDTYKLVHEYSPDSARIDTEGANLLEVTAQNLSNKKYYVYGINIMENGVIQPFLPNPGFVSNTEVPPNSTAIFDSSLLSFSDPIEYVRIIVTDSPFDVTLLAQSEYEIATRSAGAGNLSPLEAMAQGRLGGTRGTVQTAQPNPQWTTSISTFVRE